LTLYHFSKVMTDLVDYSEVRLLSQSGIALWDVSHDYWKLALPNLLCKTINNSCL